MKVPEIQKHFLALMDRPGDYVLIDVSRLSIAKGFSPNSLMELDSFTMSFSKEEILSSIKEANIANEKYLNGKLVIQDNQKHKPIEVIDRDFYNDFRIDIFLKEHISDKAVLNNIVNKFMAFVKDSDVTNNFKNALKNGDLFSACNLLFDLPYLLQRKFIVYAIEFRNAEIKKEKEQELIRDKAA